MDVPECPVCLESMTPPIFQCKTGHSLCSTCSSTLVPAKCPMCRQDMTQMRNWTLEEIIANAEAGASAAVAAEARAVSARMSSRSPAARTGPVKLSCPHQGEGCPYVFTAARDLHDHVLECIFRDMLCPYGAAFNNCYWIGKLKQMMDHFKEKHPTNWSTFSSAASGAKMQVSGVGFERDLRNVYLAAQGNMHYIVTMKIDAGARMAYWAVQHVGKKKNAQLYTYEIHVASETDAARCVVFTERCFNDVVPADEIFSQGKCACLPFALLKHYVRDEKLTFKFLVRKMTAGLINNMSNLQLA